MAKPVKITPVKNKSGLWQIRVPAKLSSTGKRTSEFYKTKSDALDRIRDIQDTAANMRDNERLMSPDQYEALSEQLGRLIPFGVTLPQVIDYYVDRHRSRDAKIVEAISPLYQDAISDKSPQYRSKVRQVLTRFVEAFGEMIIDDITADMFGDWVATWKSSPSSYNSVLRHIKPFFSWSIVKGYALGSPASGLRQRKQQTSPITILTSGGATALLEACRDYRDDDDMPAILRVDASDARVTVAILLFAGIRPHEVTMLQWDHVRLDHGYIRIEPEVSKTNSVRLVKIEDNLRSWLNTVPAKQRHGQVAPKNWPRKWKAVRKAADIGHMPDVCRHSFASYYLAKYKDTHGLLEAMGHTTSKTSIKYYLTACAPEDVPLYWSIDPGSLKRLHG